MCSSEKQNMDQIENPVSKLFSSLHKYIENKMESKNKEPKSKNEGTELDIERKKFIKELETIEQKITDLKQLVKKAKGKKCLDTTFIDLSVTGLTTDSLKTFGGTLDHDLTSLGVAVIHQSVITLPDCKDKLKKLKRLRMEGSHSGLVKLGEELGKFGKLNDLTLTNMDIGIIPKLPELLCLRLYGVCQKETYKFDSNGCPKLKKLVIGDMGTVKTVQISSAVLKRAVTLKFSNLPELKEVYTNNQHFLLKWRTSTVKVPFRDVQQNTTIFLRDFKDFPVINSPGLEIYHYNEEMQCYRIKVTQNN